MENTDNSDNWDNLDNTNILVTILAFGVFWQLFQCFFFLRKLRVHFHAKLAEMSGFSPPRSFTPLEQDLPFSTFSFALNFILSLYLTFFRMWGRGWFELLLQKYLSTPELFLYLTLLLVCIFHINSEKKYYLSLPYDIGL